MRFARVRELLFLFVVHCLLHREILQDALHATLFQQLSVRAQPLCLGFACYWVRPTLPLTVPTPVRAGVLHLDLEAPLGLAAHLLLYNELQALIAETYIKALLLYLVLANAVGVVQTSLLSLAV